MSASRESARLRTVAKANSLRHPAGVLTWRQFADACPELAKLGASFLFEFDVGLAFLGTVRADGGPRVHPICPLVTADGLYAFIVPGPKLADLRRDSRYALHSETFPPPRHDDAFYVTGRITEVDDPALRATLTQQFLAERTLEEPWPGFGDQTLIEFGIERCLLTLTEARDGFPVGHTVWHHDPKSRYEPPCPPAGASS